MIHDNSKLTPVSKTNPCPHCGKPDWCYFVGAYSVCNREQPPATGWQATDKADKDGKLFYELTPEKKAIRPKATRQWVYKDRAGNPLIQVTRIDGGEGGKPDWSQKNWNSRTGCWDKEVKRTARENIPVYRYAEVRKAIANQELIFIAEGESCVDLLWDLGIAATCNIGGAKKWRESDTNDLEGAKVVIAPDRDKKGIEHAELLNKEFPDAQWFYAYPESRVWFNLPASQGLDIKDWLDTNKSHTPITRAEILSRVGVKKVLASLPTQTVTTSTKSDLSSELDALIAQNLKPSERDLAIAILASKHKLQVSTLQGIITKKESEAEQIEGLEDLGAELIRMTKASHETLNLSEFLPEGIAKPIVSLAKKMNLKPESYLLGLLVQCGALLPAKTSTMLHKPTNYRVKPNIFGVVVSESGMKKTPVLNAISVYPMEELEDKARSDFEDAMATYETELAKWQAKNKKKDENENPKPTLPVRKVYTFNSATGEAIPAQAHRCPEQSLLLLSDELAGAFKSANQYRGGRGSDDEDLLEYWSGSGKKTLRTAGITVDVKNVSLSIFGNIQPDVLAGFLGDGKDANGKFARFDFIHQPVTATHLSLTDSPCTLTPALSKLYAYLDSLKDTQFELSEPAHEHFVKFYNWCDDKREVETKQGMRAMLGKMPAKLGKIATILHCIKAYESGKSPGREIGYDTVRVAAKFVGYCRRQVETMNSQIVTPSALAPCLIKIIDLAERKGGTVKARDVSQSFNKNHRPTNQLIKGYFEELVALNYGSITSKGLSISFTLENASSVSSVACNVDTATVLGEDTPVLTLSSPSSLSSLSGVLEDKSIKSEDKCGLSEDTPVLTFKPLSNIALSNSEDTEDTISSLPENPETLMQSCATPKPQKPQSVKKPIGIGDDVTIARSDLPAYRGVKGKIVGVEKMADGSKGFKVEFIKAVRGMWNGLFAPTDLLRTLNC
ncbi:MAG TPA: hypothetical protein DD001_11825 [Microcoleaceae bacterium UBA10368]|jgi:DNA primase (bacterial type)|nr:hypothetical protein [Microcoleaceae cyanobacterium UBA10368]HCV31016.1 hypothetical protein [Microcoleaceae cyanobacterium UBA9251]